MSVVESPGTRWLIPLWIALACVSMPLVASAEQATPQRPSFSADPSTTAPGTLELEVGYLQAEQDVADLPLTLKWGSGERTELFLGWSPWFKTPTASEYIGDTILGVRHRFLEGGPKALSLAYQVWTKVPTSDPDDGLGSGAVDAFFALTSAWSMGNLSGVGYYQFGALGRPASDGVIAENALALALAAPLADRWSAFVEWTSLWRPEPGEFDSLAVGGLGFALRPSLVLDAAVSLAMAPGDDVWAGTVGATLNFGWPGRTFHP